MDNWNNCCGAACGFGSCGDGDGCTCNGDCGMYSPDCSSGAGCNGMCGPSCDECWPGVCGDCCLWLGCFQHDTDCAVSYWSGSCIGATGVAGVEDAINVMGSRSTWCVEGYWSGHR